jgi:hypothetical protein
MDAFVQIWWLYSAALAAFVAACSTEFVAQVFTRNRPGRR